jgi:RNA polymerase subunit RPABC4/transcription elongation factor Spt4
MNTICQNCKKSGLQPDYKFCPFCGVEIEKALACPGCGNTKIQGMKFCPECGSKLDQESLKTGAEATVVDAKEAVPQQGITIEFGYSSSQNYDFAVAEAKKFPVYMAFGNQKRIRHRVVIQPDEISQVTELVNYTQGWKTSRIYENGEPSTFQVVFGFGWCYQQRRSSFKPELYCFGYEREWDLNLWGCTQARMPFRESADWFSYGKWMSKDGDWQFDKERIHHELQTALYPYRFCPAIQLELVKEVLDAIPVVVNPKKSKDWEFVEDWSSSDLTSGLIITARRYGIEDKVIMKGVRPTKSGLLAIIKKIGKGKLPAEIVR